MYRVLLLILSVLVFGCVADTSSLNNQSSGKTGSNIQNLPKIGSEDWTGPYKPKYVSAGPNDLGNYWVVSNTSNYLLWQVVEKWKNKTLEIDNNPNSDRGKKITPWAVHNLDCV